MVYCYFSLCSLPVPSRPAPECSAPLLMQTASENSKQKLTAPKGLGGCSSITGRTSLQGGTSQAGAWAGQACSKLALSPPQSLTLGHLHSWPFPALLGCAGVSILHGCHQFPPATPIQYLPETSPCLLQGLGGYVTLTLARRWRKRAVLHCQDRGRRTSALGTNSGIWGRAEACIPTTPQSHAHLPGDTPVLVPEDSGDSSQQLYCTCEKESYPIIHLWKQPRSPRVLNVISR